MQKLEVFIEESLMNFLTDELKLNFSLFFLNCSLVPTQHINNIIIVLKHCVHIVILLLP